LFYPEKPEKTKKPGKNEKPEKTGVRKEKAGKRISKHQSMWN
jgi:hypothetical protein